MFRLAYLWRRTHGRAPMIFLMGSTVSACAAFMLTSHHHKNQPKWPFGRVMTWPTRMTMCEAAIRRNETVDTTETDDDVDDDTWEIMKVPDRGQASTHIIYGTLLPSHHLLQRYDVYRCTSEMPVRRVRGMVQLGGKLDGHLGVVHGGILALLMDDVLGFGFHAIGVAMAMTANLNINYMKPVPANTAIVIDAFLDRQDGRKLYWTVVVTDANDPTLVYCNATSLYIIPRHAFQQ
jgi:acyl-coenzyme A thioesterase PaaI-like protein